MKLVVRANAQHVLHGKVPMSWPHSKAITAHFGQALLDSHGFVAEQADRKPRNLLCQLHSICILASHCGTSELQCATHHPM